MKFSKTSHLLLTTSALALLAMGQLATAAQPLTQAKESLAASDKSAQQSQHKIEKLDDKHLTLLQEYKQVLAETELLQVYNRQMEKITANQMQELASLSQQIRQVKYTEQGVLPLMNQMLDMLAKFVALDMPFLLNERQVRLKQLDNLLTRADVTVSEKYRRVLEAYQIEVEFGRTLEVYKEKDAQQILSNYLRVGRVALYKARLDFSAAQSFDKASQSWLDVDSSDLRDLKKAYSVAEQSAAPELLTLPMSRLQSATSSEQGLAK